MVNSRHSSHWRVIHIQFKRGKRFLIGKLVSLVRKWEKRPLNRRKLDISIIAGLTFLALLINLVQRVNAVFSIQPKSGVLKQAQIRASLPPEKKLKSDYLVEKNKQNRIN